jgi:endoglucanase
MWGQAKDGQWELLDPHSSADADVWMAYTLIEAGRLWNAPAYTSLGRAMMAQIAKSEVADLAGFGPMLLPGPGGVRQQQTLTLSPASMPLFVFQRFAAIDPAGPWGQVAANFPAMLAESARHGFAMDRVNYIPGDGFSPAAPIETVNDASETPGGSSDAMRVYLWAGMIDRGSPVRAQVLNAIPAMNAYLAKHDAPPQNVSDQGIPLAQDGPVGFSAAVLPYLRAFPGSSRQSARQTVRIGRMRDPSTGLYGKDLATYDQILVLFATGFIDGRFRFGMGGELNVDWTR